MAAQQRTVSTGFGFPEGPSLGPDGYLYVAEMGGARVSRVKLESGEREEFAEVPGSLGATAFGPDGAIYVTNNGGLEFADGRPSGITEDNPGGSINRVDLDGNVTTLYSECDDFRLSGPNDLVFDAEGGFYFTDPMHGDMFADPPYWPLGHVFYATPDGSRIVKVATDYNLSNGIAITPDCKTLFVAETLTSKIWAHDIEAPGEIGERREYAQLPEGHFPDGFTLDSEGYIVCAAVGAGALIVFDPEGQQVDRIPTEDTDVTNVCFAGPDHSTLFATEGRAGRLIAFDWPRRGMVPFHTPWAS